MVIQEWFWPVRRTRLSRPRDSVVLPDREIGKQTMPTPVLTVLEEDRHAWFAGRTRAILTYLDAERIRATIEQTPVHYDGSEIRFTASLGFVAVSHDTIVSSDILVYQAAAALKEAKARGRNCCVVSPLAAQSGLPLVGAAS